MDFGTAGGAALFSGLHRFCVLRRFHRRNLRGNSSGTGAGQQYRDQCKQCGSEENQRGGADGCNAGTEGGSRHDHRGQKRAHTIAQQQSHGNPHCAQQQCLLADDPAQLTGRDTDGFQQTVVANISVDGNLEDVVNNQIPGKNHQRQKRDNGKNRCGIDAFSQLGSGIAPVDANPNYIVTSVPLPGIPQIRVYLFHLSPDIHGGCHHDIQVCAERVHSGGDALRFHRPGVFLGYIDVVNRADIVIFPPPRQGKGICFFVRALVFIPYGKGERDLGAQFRFYPQQP